MTTTNAVYPTWYPAPCPNCGYCPCCGRPTHIPYVPTYPVYPSPWFGPYTITYTTTTGASDASSPGTQTKG